MGNTLSLFGQTDRVKRLNA